MEHAGSLVRLLAPTSLAAALGALLLHAGCGTAGGDAASAPDACATGSGDAGAIACTLGTAGDGVTCTSEADLLAKPECAAPAGGVSAGVADHGACGDGGAVAMRCLGCAAPCRVVASGEGPRPACAPDETTRAQAASACAGLGGCLTVHDVLLGGACPAGSSSQFVVSCCPP